MKISFFLLIILSHSSYSASVCQQNNSFKEVDLRSEMGPVRNQGGVGWCYAFTAADLMTHYRLKKKQISSVTPDTMVSAVGVSAKYNQEFFRYYDPKKELQNKLNELDKIEKQKKEVESAKASRLNHPYYYKVHDYILSLSPFNKSTKSGSEPPSTQVKNAATSPSVTQVPKPKALKKGDLIPWDQASISDTFGLPLTYENTKKLKPATDLIGSLAIFNHSSDQRNAAEYKKQGIDIIASSGYIFAAIDSSRNGYCTENEARSGDVGLEQFDLKQMLDTVYDSAGKTEFISCSPLLNIHKMLPALNLKNIADILTHANRASAYQILINNICQRKLSNNIDEPKIEGQALIDSYLKDETRITEGQIELLKKLDSVLDGGTPVGINYFSNFLINPAGEKTSKHASSIVGKRINPSTCEEEYILRNSYGPGCAYYKKPNNEYIACIASANSEKSDKLKNRKKSECDRKNTPAFYNPKVSCEESSGYVFVAKSELGKHLFGITYLKE